jgi:hypothetical protein
MRHISMHYGDSVQKGKQVQQVRTCSPMIRFVRDMTGILFLIRILPDRRNNLVQMRPDYYRHG